MKISRFEKPLRASPHNQIMAWTLIGLAIVGYFLPWLNSGAVSLTFGAYDLGEWISLRLPARPMDTVSLLRSIPVLITVLIGLYGAQHQRGNAWWWLSAAVILLISLALLPPFEFFLDSNLRNDVNYAQQFRLSGAAFVLGVFCLSGILRRFHTIAVLIVGLVLVGLTGMSVIQTGSILDSLGLNPRLGLGPFILMVSSVILSFVEIAPLRRRLSLRPNKKDSSV